MKPRAMTSRLEAVFSIVPTADVIADIGTDHGYLAVELINRGTAKRVIAGDVHKGPLDSAKSYIKSIGLEDRIDCRLGDGLQVTQIGELNGAICCGMGGFLMRDIVKKGPERLEFYVLQPQNGQSELRQYMVTQGYHIIKEIIIKDMGKLYTAFLAVREDLVNAYGSEGNHVYQDISKDSILWSVGALLADKKPPLWQEYIDHLIYQRQCVLDDMTEVLEHTEKYKVLVADIEALSALR